MTRSGSPCGACRSLRGKCVTGCVFAPYFCHKQGATHFAAIHKVFGASNVSKLLAHLPVSDRSKAAITISYEAQARLQDPIYGCVSHLFTLQQQVVNLQVQLAYLREQAAQNFLNTFAAKNPSDNYSGQFTTTFPHDPYYWFQTQNFDMAEPHHSLPMMNLNPIEYYKNLGTLEENISFPSFDETTSNSMSYDVQASSNPFMNLNPISYYENSGTLEDVV